MTSSFKYVNKIRLSLVNEMDMPAVTLRENRMKIETAIDSSTIYGAAKSHKRLTGLIRITRLPSFAQLHNWRLNNRFFYSRIHTEPNIKSVINNQGS